MKILPSNINHDNLKISSLLLFFLLFLGISLIVEKAQADTVLFPYIVAEPDFPEARAPLARQLRVYEDRIEFSIANRNATIRNCTGLPSDKLTTRIYDYDDLDLNSFISEDGKLYFSFSEESYNFFHPLSEYIMDQIETRKLNILGTVLSRTEQISEISMITYRSIDENNLKSFTINSYCNGITRYGIHDRKRVRFDLNEESATRIIEIIQSLHRIE